MKLKPILKAVVGGFSLLLLIGVAQALVMLPLSFLMAFLSSSLRSASSSFFSLVLLEAFMMWTMLCGGILLARQFIKWFKLNFTIEAFRAFYIICLFWFIIRSIFVFDGVSAVLLVIYIYLVMTVIQQRFVKQNDLKFDKPLFEKGEL